MTNIQLNGSNVEIVTRNGEHEVTINGITTYGIKGEVSVVDGKIYSNGSLLDNKGLTKVNTKLAKQLWTERADRDAEAKEDKAYGDIRRKLQASADYRGDSLMSHVKTLEDENKKLKAAIQKPDHEYEKHLASVSNAGRHSFNMRLAFASLVMAGIITLLLIFV